MATSDVSGLRIAVVCPYAMDVPGGVQSHAHGLAAQLGTCGAEVNLFAPGRSSPQGAEFASIGVAQAFPDNGSVSRTVVAPWSLARLARRLRSAYDIVHVHEPMLPPCLTAIAATDAPVVATFHMSASDARWYRRFLPIVRRAWTRIDAAVAVSPLARDVAASVLPGDYRIIPNAVETRPGVLAPANGHGPANGGGGADGNGLPRLLYVGRADPRKGLDVLLQAFRRMSVAARLDLAGPDPAATTDPGVHAHGHVSELRLRSLLETADVVCVPSLRAESFGIVIVEAMAAGTAVVASDLDGYAQVLPNDCGRLVPAGDPDALAGALEALICSPATLRRMGEAGRRRARAYDWDAVLPRILEVYAEAAEHRRAARGGRGA
jgi:phosphatidyl-myo-inositol alpha-mannosyltransferase